MAVVALHRGSGVILVAVVLYVIAAALAIAALDSTFARPAVAPDGRTQTGATRSLRARRSARLLLVPLGAAIAASPFFDGYYSSRVWVPLGLGLVAVATACAIGRPARLTAPAAIGLAGLGGLALLSLVSAQWAANPEEAYGAANRLLVYLLLALVLFLAIQTERAAVWLLGSIGAGALIVAAWTAVRMLGDDSVSAFVGGRLLEPLGYINGQGAFFAISAWLFLAAAEQRRWPLLSGAGLAAAVLTSSLAILSQSRGVALSALAAAVVCLALVPGRIRRAWTLGALAAGVAPALPSLLEIYSEAGGNRIDPPTAHDAASLALVCAVTAGALWAALTALTSHVERRAPWTPRLAAGAVAVAAVAALIVGAASAGTIHRTVSDQYDVFVHLEGTGEPAESTRLISGAGHRYDYWRIAWSAFRDNPVGGVGAGNYRDTYFAKRVTVEDVRQPHSLQFQALAELGILGAVLVVLVVASFGWGAWRSARAGRTDALARTLAIAGVGVGTTWLVHTSVDWLHLIPGVTAIAIAAGAVLVRPIGSVQPEYARPARPVRRIATVFATALTLVLACVLLARQGLSENYLSEAQAALPNDPATALTEADRALRIAPDKLDAYYVKAAALARFDRGTAAVATLREATRRVPDHYVTWALLGDLAMRLGERREARRLYARALALNPRDPTLQELARAPDASQSRASDR
jgi:tetratricopeptide (TPR) repeat protein